MIDVNEQLLKQNCTNINFLSLQSKSAYINAELGTSSKYLDSKILIDTGADFNVLDSRLLTQMRRKGIKCPLLAPKRKAPVAANNHPLILLGDCELDIRLTSTNCKSSTLRRVRFQVLGNLFTMCIIGINTLREIGLFVKGDTIKLGGQQICQLTNSDKRIHLVESFNDDNGAKWAVYTDSLVFQEESDWLSANHVDSLDENSAGGTSTEYEPREMKPGKYLVFLNDTDVPKELVINKMEHTSWLNELKNCNEKSKRKLITDEIMDYW